MDYKVALGIIAILMALYSYVPYVKDIFAGKTKPHAFTWLVWGLLTSIAFFGQMADKGGPGAWVTGISAALCIFTFFLALQKGEKNITKSDWFSLGACGVAMVLWFLTKTPLWSVILVTVIDLLAFYPTIRKSYWKPYEETLVTYLISGLKFIIAIIALENFSVITWLYPASLIFINLGFVWMLVVRRRATKPNA